MDDLVSFLRARLDEDEARARSVLPPSVVVGEAETGATDGRTGQKLRTPVYGYAWDPARVLRQVEAGRQLIELAADATGLDMRVDQEFRIETRDEAEEPYAGDLILRQLAVVYSDHPDYRQEWKP